MNTLGRQLSTVSSQTSRTCRKRQWNISCSGPSTSRRSLHRRRALPYPVENGIGEFLPPPALKTVMDWQEGLLDRLNHQVKGTSDAGKSVWEVVKETAADDKKIMTFNYASLALNNSFFLDNLKPPAHQTSSNEGEISPMLAGDIVTNFGDFEKLKSYVVASASGMFSSGWVWLVTDGQKNLAVIPTFGAGTLLVQSRTYRTHTQDILAGEIQGSSTTTPMSTSPSTPSPVPPLNTSPSVTSPVSGMSSSLSPLNPNTPSRSIQYSSSTYNRGWSAPVPSVLSEEAGDVAVSPDIKQKNWYNRGSVIFPLFCVSVHEHAWMSAGLGVWGKEEFVKRFFSAVHWGKVSEVYSKWHGIDNRGTAAFR